MSVGGVKGEGVVARGRGEGGREAVQGEDVFEGERR